MNRTADQCSLFLLKGFVAPASLVALLAVSSPAQVIVERVWKASPAANAGLEPGDTIHSWSTTGASGVIFSPFDFEEVLGEYCPRGPVAFRGLQQGQERTWVLADATVMAGSNSGITVRPVLSSELLASYRESQKLAAQGKSNEAATLFRTAVSKVTQADPPWMSCWILVHVAELIDWTGDPGDPDSEDSAINEAVERSRSAAPNLTAPLLERWATSLTAFKKPNLGQVRLSRLRQALEAQSKQAGESLGLARILYHLGKETWGSTELSSREALHNTAVEYVEEALAIQERLAPHSLDVVRSLELLGQLARGDVYVAGGVSDTSYKESFARSLARERDDIAKSNAYYQRAIEISEKLDRGSLESLLGAVALIAWQEGDFEKAEEYYRREFEICRELDIEQGNSVGSFALIVILEGLGRLEHDRGDLWKADTYLRQALAMNERLTEPWLGSWPEAVSAFTSWANLCWELLATIAQERGDLLKAEGILRQALAASEKSNSSSFKFVAFALGRLVEQRGDLEKAEEYYSKSAGLDTLGNIAESRGDIGRAESYYRQQLEIEERRSSYLGALVDLGRIAVHRGDLSQAEEYGRRALESARKLARGDIRAAERLWDLGVAEGREDLSPEESFYREVLSINQNRAGGRISVSQGLHDFAVRLRRKGNLEGAVNYFGQAVDALELQIARLGSTEEVRAQFRARNAGFYRDYIDALLDQKLAQKERAFGILERSRARSFLDTLAERDIVFSQDLPSDLKGAQRLNAADYDRTQATLSKLNPATEKEHFDQALGRLRELSDERDQIIERIRHAAPRLAALQYPQPLDLTATRQALDSGTTLLSYSVGAEKTTLFVVQPAGTDPGLTVVSIPISEKELRSEVDAFRHRLEQPGESSHAALIEQGRKLYDLLVRPAESLLADGKRILIVPDGPLHLLPFAGLLRNEHQYLVEWKPLHLAVSATVYAELRKMRRKDNNGPVEVAAFGDPQYQAADSKQAEETRNLELRSALEGGFRFGRLAFSRGEVNHICDLYTGHCQKYLGAEATEERAKSLDKQVRYVHFATHAYLDEKLPLNSAVVLSIPEKLAEGQENGLLQAWEIFDQVRLDADLVVLSACKTALGQEVNGEGLIGLTRAFHYAGARSVLASLWNVEDYRTAELMQEFYRHLRKGESKDEALREAQLWLLHARSSSHPYYWAAFTLSGDWR